MIRRQLLTLCAVIAVASVACSSGDDASESPSGTVATAAPETTTTTELTVEEEVEAAYLRSWDVYAQAMRTLDTKDLDEVFAGVALDIVLEDVEKLRAAGHRARMQVVHDYTISVGETAVIADKYVNHSMLLDGDSGEPIEDDPNETLTYMYALSLIEDTWKVTDIFLP